MRLFVLCFAIGGAAFGLGATIWLIWDIFAASVTYSFLLFFPFCTFMLSIASLAMGLSYWYTTGE